MNIQKYSIHDGPGIRTTVFFKGCPLKCWWCHNPESQNYQHDIMYYDERCTGCGVCIKRCPQGALSMVDNKVVRDTKKCELCGNCTDFCPRSAREYVGQDVTVRELMKEINKDAIFYEQSGGGVTFSGGEPMTQAKFLLEMLKACKEKGYHTTVDVSGYGRWEDFQSILDYVDLFLFDVKLMNDEAHKKYMGLSNKEIFENLKKLSDAGTNMYVRMPIIAGVNDDDENIRLSIEFLKKIHLQHVNLLPYHKMGMEKYRRLNLTYQLTGEERPTEEKMNAIADLFMEAGIKAKIGG